MAGAAIWLFLRRIPRGIALLFNFIIIFLTIFLLVGCYNLSNDNTYLVRYEVDKASPFFDVIKTSFASQSRTEGLEKVKIRSGYMGICVEKVPTTYNLQNEELTSYCYPRKNLTGTPLFNDMSIQLFNTNSKNSSNPIQLNILQLAQLTSVNVVHPYILMATIILTLIQFLTILYQILPYLPYKNQLNKFLLLLSPVLVLVWGMGAIWMHVGIHASSRLVPAASMGIINVYTGHKAASMAWFSFAFLLVECIILWAIHVRDLRDLNEEATVNVTNSYPQNYYYSDSSSTSHPTKV